ncbi:MAG: AraC family transcriptional regulator [Xanthomonadales bacterium]|nr:AraC family transcriptional regulator [Xanthomonadales bacterium]
MTENPNLRSKPPSSYLDKSSVVNNALRLNKRKRLIENKVSFFGPKSELSIYDTYRSAKRVRLNADQLTYCGMVTGRKIMHSHFKNEKKSQAKIFLPNESFVIPPGEYVEIDFPDTSELQPTTCLTIEIPKERIETISEQMNDLVPFEGIDYDWQYQPHVIHTHHSSATQFLIEKLVHLYTLDHSDREMMIGLGVSELIVRLLRQQGSEVLLSYAKKNPDATGITAVIDYLEKNSAQSLTIETLCKTACLSRSKLYTEFKKQLGRSPNEYLHQLRLKKAAILLEEGKTVTQACFEVGFKALSHFSRRFVSLYNCTPNQYRKRHHLLKRDC